MALFYVSGIINNECTLNAEESAHCVRVLRHVAGDSIRLTDGMGFFYDASIINANAKACTVSITKKMEEQNPQPFYLHIAIAPPKNADRFEWFIEKAVETGISRITPLMCRHSERNRVNHERLSKILVSAMKQSERATLPVLSQAVTFDVMIKQVDEAFRYIAHCENGHRDRIGNNYKKNGSAIVMIGPEGDFSRDEIELALQAGCCPVSLGDHRLRTETAALNACTILNYLNE